MRPAAEPLPRGQAFLTAVIVEHPKLANRALKEGVHDQVSDPRLRPILDGVIDAARDGHKVPSEGELLSRLDPSLHRTLHSAVFDRDDVGDDALAAFDSALRRCQQDQLELEIRQVSHQLADAHRRGDEAGARDLAQRRVELRRRQAALRTFN